MFKVDIVIVGSGFAGLSAAKCFSSKGLKYLIIEGRSRVGGRTLTEKINDKLTIDLGGQWIGPNQKRILSLIEQFSFELIEQTWYHHNPNHLGETIGLIPLNNDQIEQINLINLEWDQMSLELPNVEKALLYQKSSLWSQISLEQFLEKHSLNLDQRVKQELKLQILTLTACDSCKVSLLYWLILIRSIDGGLKSLDDGLNGAQHYKIKGGSQQICFQLSLNENIRFNDSLKSINYQLNNQIILTLNSGYQIECSRLLLAFSPSLLSTIEFSPQLSEESFCQMIMGQCIKTIFIYSNSFWKNKKIHLNEKSEPCSNIFESDHPIALIGLILGQNASFWTKKDEKQLIEAIIEQYSILYQTNQKPEKTFIQYWTKETLSGGCYAGVYPPSLSSTWRDKTKSLIDGRIWLASTEMALEWIGYIEGAIEAGQRIAQLIIQSL